MLGKNKNKWFKNKKSKKPPNGSASTKTPVKGVVTYTGKKDCHKDPCEVIPHLWLGSSWAEDDIKKHCKIIVSLASLDGHVWDDLWRGEIIYVPISDYKSLPADVLLKYAERVALLVNDGHDVGMFCVGGHGRTGYFASAVLHLLGDCYREHPDPIGFLRDKYCEKAVESIEQMKSLEVFTGISGLVAKYPEKKISAYYGGSSYWKGGSDYNKSYFSAGYDDYDYYDDLWKRYDDDLVKKTDKYRGCDSNLPATNPQNPCYDCIHFDWESPNLDKCDHDFKVGIKCSHFYSYVEEPVSVATKVGKGVMPI